MKRDKFGKEDCDKLNVNKWEKLKNLLKSFRQHLSKKKMNKLKHTEEGNKAGNVLRVAWWNDKSA